MTRAFLLALAATAATPAFAQHAGHAPPEPAPAQPSPAPAVACTPEHAAMGHCRLPPAPVTSRANPQADHVGPAPAPASCTPEHAAMGHCRLAPVPPPPPPVPSCTPEHAAMGHCTLPTTPAVTPVEDHADHAPAAPMPAPAVAAPPPQALTGPAHAADAIFGDRAMAEAREALRRSHGDVRVQRFGIDQLEARFSSGEEGYAWEDLHFWYGGDINRLRVESEGEGEFGGGVERAEVQALWSRAITPFFDLQAGLRYDFEPSPSRAHLVLAMEGLAPYWFEVEGALFLSEEGDLTARFEGEYDLRVTQRLILQPRVELDLAAQDVPELGIGSGLTNAEAGLRLRYEIVPEFAPYVGVQYERSLGGTARLARAAGEETGRWSLVAGIRAWF